MADDENPRPTSSVSQMSVHGRGIPNLDNIASFVDAAWAKHRENAHKFVDELFDNTAQSEDSNRWRRLLSAMMEDYQRWQVRDPDKGYSPSMLLVLEDMRDK